MPTDTRPIVLLLPGQGAQQQGMAVELYERDRPFRDAVDELLELMGTHGAALRRDWLSPCPAVPLDDASRAQPLLFAVGYGLGCALRARGVDVVGLLGHSVGELAAAALAGVFDPAGAARVLLARTAAMALAPAGGMLAVAATPDQLEFYLDDPADPRAVVVAAHNAPRQTVLAGPEPELSAVGDRLRRAGLVAQRVPARQPFHCPAVAGAARRFAAGIADVALRPPRVPIQSTATAAPVTAGQAVDPTFWAGQLARPVLFWPALEELLSGPGLRLVEAGPGRGLSAVARRHKAVRAGHSAVLPLLPRTPAGSWRTWRAALDELVG